MKRNLPVWRTLLYVPVNVERYVDKAHTRGADVIQLDLEDAVPHAEKAYARTLVEKSAARVRRGGADVLVRINRPIAMAVRDIEASICPDVDAIAITKCDSASHVRILDELVTELEEARGMTVGHTKFNAMVETPDAFSRMQEIFSASERVVAGTLGGEDFALGCGFQPTGEALLFPKQQMIIAAAAAGVMPLGFIDSIAGFGDWEKFRAMVRRSRDFGFMGAGCIHPGQVAIVNEEYKPSDEEVAYARKLITADEEAKRQGRGSFALDGRMVDIPIIERAQRLIARHEAIQAREARRMAS